MKTDMITFRATVAQMSADLIAANGIAFEATTERQRQLLSTFAFGMNFAVGQVEKLSPPEVHALAITMLVDTFKYSPEQAAAFSQMLIDDTGPTGNATRKAFIHRGIDGHAQWTSKSFVALSENIKSAMAAVGA